MKFALVSCRFSFDLFVPMFSFLVWFCVSVLYLSILCVSNFHATCVYVCLFACDVNWSDSNGQEILFTLPSRSTDLWIRINAMGRAMGCTVCMF